MQIPLIQIGNSRGIRLPKKIIDQCQIDSKLTLSIEEGKIILEATPSSPREGWEEAAILASQTPDELNELQDLFDDEEILEW